MTIQPPPPVDPPSLGDRLGIARRLRGLTQAALAEKSGVPQVQVSRIESGAIAEPAFSQVFKLAEALEVSMTALGQKNTDLLLFELKDAETTKPRNTFSDLNNENTLIVDPYSVPAGMIPLGKNSHDQTVALSSGVMDQHVFVAGRTGTGKSEFLKHLVSGVAKTDMPIMVLDAAGGVVDDVIDLITSEVPERAKDVVLLDFSKEEDPPAFNVLDVHHKDQIEPTVSAVLETVDKMMNWGGSAPRAQSLLSQALHALCEANLAMNTENELVANGPLATKLYKSNLLHVPVFFTDTEFRQLVVSFSSNLTVRETFDPTNGPFETLPTKQQQEYAMPLIRAFRALATAPGYKDVFSCSDNKINWPDLINANSIILVKGSRFSHQRISGEFATSLVLNSALSTMDDWGRKKDPDTGAISGRGLRLFIDEAPQLIGARSSVPQLLAEARKWDLGITSFCQYPQQFDENIMKAIMANTANKITFALDPASSLNIVKSISGPTDKLKASDISELPNFHFYANTLVPQDGGGKAPSGPFGAKALEPIKIEVDLDLRKDLMDRAKQFGVEKRDNKAAAELIKISLLSLKIMDDTDPETEDPDWTNL